MSLVKFRNRELARTARVEVFPSYRLSAGMLLAASFSCASACAPEPPIEYQRAQHRAKVDAGVGLPSDGDSGAMVSDVESMDAAVQPSEPQRPLRDPLRPHRPPRASIDAGDEPSDVDASNIDPSCCSTNVPREDETDDAGNGAVAFPDAGDASVFPQLECADASNCAPPSEARDAGCDCGDAGVVVPPDPDDDGDSVSATRDCDDNDPNNWTSCDTCADADGDGAYLRCDAYDTVMGPDCADGDAATTSCPRNLILMVADGWGFEQLEAARMFKNGNTEPLFLETLPVSGEVMTDNVDGVTTDSAAAASAMATGKKYPNGAISWLGGSDVTTVLEQHVAAGKLTGLVTSYTSVLDATPAAFAAHETSRGKVSEIALDMQTLGPNLLMGLPDATMSDFAAAGYTVVTTAEELAQVDTNAMHVLGMFDDESPALPDRADFALRHLDQGADGFFLLLETESTDNNGHDSNLPGVIAAVLEFDATVQRVVEWASARPAADTRILVLSDHETGGLDVFETEPQAGVVPDDYTYTTPGSHSSRNIPIFVYGGTLPADIIDNTDVFELLGGTP